MNRQKIIYRLIGDSQNIRTTLNTVDMQTKTTVMMNMAMRIGLLVSTMWENPPFSGDSPIFEWHRNKNMLMVIKVAARDPSKATLLQDKMVGRILILI